MRIFPIHHDLLVKVEKFAICFGFKHQILKKKIRVFFSHFFFIIIREHTYLFQENLKIHNSKIFRLIKIFIIK